MWVVNAKLDEKRNRWKYDRLCASRFCSSNRRITDRWLLVGKGWQEEDSFSTFFVFFFFFVGCDILGMRKFSYCCFVGRYLIWKLHELAPLKYSYAVKPLKVTFLVSCQLRPAFKALNCAFLFFHGDRFPKLRKVTGRATELHKRQEHINNLCGTLWNQVLNELSKWWSIPQH